MSWFARLRFGLVGLLGLLVSMPLLADSPETAKKKETKKAAVKFVRVKRDAKNQPVAMETASVRYVPAEGTDDLVVDLIGVVHVGDKSYYQKLNEQFEQYDALLYELVAPKGTRVPKGAKQRNDNPLSMLQNLMKNALELESQLEHIDYTKKNFVHADMSPEQMAEAMRERGDDAITIFLGLLADILRQQNAQEARRRENPGKDEPDLDFFALLLDPDRGTKLRRLMAQQLEGDADTGGLGQTLKTLLITDRNQAAMKVLHKEIDAGKKKLAIFYGAAHMPDFDQRLREEFGLKRQSEEWVAAWDLRPRGKGMPDLLKRLGK